MEDNILQSDFNIPPALVTEVAQMSDRLNAEMRRNQGPDLFERMGGHEGIKKIFDKAWNEVAMEKTTEYFRSLLSPELAAIDQKLEAIDKRLRETSDEGDDKFDPLFLLVSEALDAHPEYIKALDSLDPDDKEDYAPEKPSAESMAFSRDVHQQIRAALFPEISSRYENLLLQVNPYLKGNNHEILDDPTLVNEIFSIMEHQEYIKTVDAVHIAMMPKRKAFLQSHEIDTPHA